MKNIIITTTLALTTVIATAQNASKISTTLINTSKATYATTSGTAAAKDFKTVFVVPLNIATINNCNYGIDTLVAQIKNVGTIADSNIKVTFRVNGVSAGMMVWPAKMAPGDSAYVFLTPAYNFSASTIYTIDAYTTVVADGNTANDTAKLSIVNSQPTALTSTVYSNGIESNYDFQSLTRVGVSGPSLVGFGPSSITYHTGLKATFFTVAAAATGAGTYESKLILPCVDVIAGETYRISYWRKSNGTATTVNGMSGVFTGLTNDAAGVTNVVTAYSAITPNPLSTDPWTKDSVDYTAMATGTRYFALGAKGTQSATMGINVRFDDIKIAKVTAPVAVNTLLLNTNTLAPNPAANYITITNVIVGEIITVYNMLGSVVLTDKVTTTNHTLNTTDLNNGTYVVRAGNATPIRFNIAK
jgi:hypothetical protein